MVVERARGRGGHSGVSGDGNDNGNDNDDDNDDDDDNWRVRRTLHAPSTSTNHQPPARAHEKLKTQNSKRTFAQYTLRSLVMASDPSSITRALLTMSFCTATAISMPCFSSTSFFIPRQS